VDGEHGPRNGTLHLDVVNGTASRTGGTPLAGTPFTGETYQIDKGGTVSAAAKDNWWRVRHGGYALFNDVQLSTCRDAFACSRMARSWRPEASAARYECQSERPAAGYCTLQLARYSSGGVPDASFGSNGHIVTAITSVTPEVNLP
jgi:hypothetical protein